MNTLAVTCDNISIESIRVDFNWLKKPLAIFLVFTMGLFFIESALACFTEDDIANAESTASFMETTYESAEATAAALEDDALALTLTVLLNPLALPELVSVESAVAVANGVALAAGVAALAAQGVVSYEQANVCCPKTK